MPFDNENLLPLTNDGGRDAPSVPETSTDDPALRCACPMCTGKISVIEADPADPQGFLNADQRGGVGDINSKPSKTVAEAAYHLNRTYATWNDFYIQPGVSHEENEWDDPYWGGATSYVTFAFRSNMTGASYPEDTAGFTRFNEAQINATLLALQSWSDVANIVFTRVGEGTTGEAAYSNSATMLFSNYNGAVDDPAAAFAFYPSLSASGGDVWVNSDLGYNQNPSSANYGALVLVHEIGHAIGLSHPGDYNAGEGDAPITYENSAEYFEDSRQYTVMSYFGESNTGASFGGRYAASPLLDDIASIQRAYGVNWTTRTGDTVYGFNSTAGRPWYEATSNTTKVIFAVWDGGGVDTLDFSGYTQGGTIDLRQGHFSSVGGLIGNVAIAMKAVIENAIGGSGADTLHGNSSANRLQGNGGADTYTGHGGADIFVVTVGGGTDTVTDFNVGTDLMDVAAFGAYLGVVQNGANTVVSFAGGVALTLLNIVASTITAASFIGLAGAWNEIAGTSAGETLNGTSGADHIQGLGGDDTLNGSGGDDWLEGGAGLDTLDGGTGADQMAGGLNADVYIVDNVGDVITENGGGDGDEVRTNLSSYTLGAELESLVGTSGAGQTLTGNDLHNAISGGSGNDVLSGGGGSDALVGQFGADQMTGGTGDDYYSVENAGDTVTEAAGEGTDTVQTTLASYTLGANVEILLAAGGANQTLTGNGLANTIEGWIGADRITGGAGNDTLTGGAAADVFVATSGGGADTITDFAVGTDKIDVSAFGGVESVVQQGSDTLVTVASGVTFLLLGVTASAVTGASFIGVVGPNVINGTSATETLNGTAGIDHINGLAGDDTLKGLGGNDVLTGAAGIDKLYGGDANDTLQGDDDADRLYGEAGNDNLVGGAGNDTMQGGDGDDRMEGGAGNDQLVSGDGADVIVVSVGGGADTATDFNVATDKIDVTAYGGYQSMAQNGADVLLVFATGVSLRLKNVTLASVTTANFIGLPAGPAPNVINGTAAAETLNGTSGVDQISGLGANDVLNGAGDNDILDGGEGNDTLNGGVGADQMTGGAGDDLFMVDNAGDQTLESVGGGDFDRVETGLSTWTLAANIERLFGTSGAGQTLNGNTGANLIVGGAGVDTLNGGDGDDTLNGGGGADVLAGGLGNDMYLVDNVGDVINESAGQGTDGVQTTLASYTLGANLENLSGDGATNQTLTGNSLNNIITGDDGADTITGAGGNDFMNGYAGADVFVATAGGGADQIQGFVVGTDRIDLTAFGAYQSIVQDGADTLVTIVSGVTMRLLGVSAATVTDASFIGLSVTPPTFNEINGTAAGETINGTAARDHIQGLGGADTLRGQGADDWLEGGDGGDQLYGGDGADELSGGLEVDRLYGEAGDDVLDGGLGNDVVQGGAGSDTMSGGGGNDTFRYDAFAEFGVGVLDRILDFSSGDRINVSGLDANVNVAGDQAFVVVGSFSGAAGQIVTTYNAGTNETLVQFDVNGDGAADYALIVNGNPVFAWVL